MAISTDDRCKAQNILTSDMSDDLKLYEVFQIYKEDIRGTQLYYALLAWKDTHLKELLKEQSKLQCSIKNEGKQSDYNGGYKHGC